MSTATGPDVAQAVQEMMGPGGPFEIAVEDVLGVPLQVYRRRLHSLRELVDASAARGDVPFLVQGDDRWSYAEHHAVVRAVVAGFVARGVEPGDRVIILSANTREWVATWWACAALGAVAVPLNAWWTPRELEFAIGDSGAVALVADAKRWATVAETASVASALHHVFVTGAEASSAGSALDRSAGGSVTVEPFDTLLRSPPLDSTPPSESAPGWPAPAPDEDDLMAILYTSGTTGRPKGATLTHRQTIANLQNLALGAALGTRLGSAAPEGAGAQPASLLIVPLFHVTGCCATMIPAFASGSKLALMPTGRFDPDRVMATIERERISSFGGVPTILWRIVASPNFSRYDLSCVTRIGYGGAPSAPELLARIDECFPQAHRSLSTAYGLTETASVATANTGDDYFSHPGSCGRPVPTVELRIMDPDGRAQPLGETGEIALRGPTVMRRGYWNRPDATAEVIDSDGWFRTGDVGHVDAAGFLYISDRAKDMIIRAGENVYCVEVEDALFAHSDVEDVAVVGVPHSVLGEEVKAVVVLRRGATEDSEALRAWCAPRLASFKVPDHWEFRAELPRNPAGKVLKNLLRGDEAAFAPSADSDSAL